MGLLEALRSAVRGSRVGRAFSTAGSRRALPAICFDSSGLGVLPDPSSEAEPQMVLTWAEVAKVTVLKRDLLTTDLICVRFVSTSGLQIEVNEEMGGWARLLDSLPTFLPRCKSGHEILGSVLEPSFATKETTVYERES